MKYIKKKDELVAMGLAELTPDPSRIKRILKTQRSSFDGKSYTFSEGSDPLSKNNKIFLLFNKF